MPVAAIAPIIGLGIGGSVASSVIGANASKDAANAQVQAANNAANLQHQDTQAALDFQKQQYQNSLNMMQPWVGTGTSAINRLGYLMGLAPGTQSSAPVSNTNTNQIPSQINFNPGTGGLDPANSGGFLRANAFGGTQPKLLTDVNGAQLDPRNMPAGFNASTINSNPQLQQGLNIFDPRTQTFSPLRTNTVVDPTTAAVDTIRESSAPINGSSLNVNQLFPGQNFGINPAGGALNPNDPSVTPFQNPDTLPGSWPGLNGVTASTNQGGSAQVPRIDGGGAPGAASNDPANQFGYLAQTWNENFQAPTDVTEQNDPGYQFRLKQGMQALENSAASRGNLLTGGTAKGLNDYAQNSASNEYGNVYNRAFNDYTTRYNQFKQNQNDLFNRFATLSGVGQTSAGQLSNAGLQSANNVGNILMTSGQQIGNSLQNAGAARGSGYVGSANAITGGINGITNMAQLLSMMGNNNGGLFA